MSKVGFNLIALFKSQGKNEVKGRKISIRTRDETKEVENLINSHVQNLNSKLEELIGEYEKKKLIKNMKNEPKVTKTSFQLVPFNYNINTPRILENIFSKGNKTKNEMIYIQHYLTCFKSLLTDIIQIKLSTDPNILLSQIAKFLKMEKLTHNQILFKFGEKEDKFFFLLSGEVAVIKIREKIKDLTENEYIIYLCKLLKYKEYGLILHIIEVNHNIFNGIQVQHIKSFIIEKLSFQKKRIQSPTKTIRDCPTKKNQLIKEIISIDEYIKRVSQENLEKQVNPLLLNINDSKENNNSFSFEEDEDNLIFKEISNLKNKINNQKKLNIKHKNISLFEYYKENELHQCITFGNIDSINEYNKRPSTVISIGECITGFLSNRTFKKCIKSCQDLVRSINIHSVKNLPIFQKISFEQFNDKYFNHFNFVNYHSGNYIFKQKEERKKVFFINEGEIELSMRGCIIDINNILHSLDENDILKRNRILNKNQLEDDAYANVYNKDSNIIKWRIINQYPNDVVGLNDCIFINVYFMSAKCLTENVKIYEIEIKDFLNMIEDKNIYNEYKKFEKLKKKMIIKRLQNLREVYIYQKYKEKEDSKNNNLIFKSEKSLSPKIKTQYIRKSKIKLFRAFSDEKMKINSNLNSNFNIFKKENMNLLNKINKPSISSHRNNSSSNQNTISFSNFLTPTKVKHPELTHLKSLSSQKKLLIKNKSSYVKKTYKPYMIESNFSNYVKSVIDTFIDNPTNVGHSNLFNLTSIKSKNERNFFHNLHLKYVTEDNNNNNELKKQYFESGRTNNNKKFKIKSLKIKNILKKEKDIQKN